LSYPFVATFPAAAAAAVCALQTTAGAGALVLNGTLASVPNPGGANIPASVTFPLIQRVLSINCAADIHTVNFTVVGTDVLGNAVTEALIGPTAGATVETAKQYHTVTSISVDAAVGTNVRVGSGSVGVTAWFKTNTFADPTNMTVACAITSTTSYSVQDTPSDIETNASPTIFTHPTLVTLTASAESNYAFPPQAVRGSMISSSGSGACTLTITQAGK
jgi:hypothetical protein